MSGGAFEPLLLNAVGSPNSACTPVSSRHGGREKHKLACEQRRKLYRLPIVGLWCDCCDGPAHGLPPELKELARGEEVLIKSLGKVVQEYGLHTMEWSRLWCHECDAPAHGLPKTIRAKLQDASDKLKAQQSRSEGLETAGSARFLPIASKQQFLAQSMEKGAGSSTVGKASPIKLTTSSPLMAGGERAGESPPASGRMPPAAAGSKRVPTALQSLLHVAHAKEHCESQRRMEEALAEVMNTPHHAGLHPYTAQTTLHDPYPGKSPPAGAAEMELLASALPAQPLKSPRAVAGLKGTTRHSHRPAHQNPARPHMLRQAPLTPRESQHPEASVFDMGDTYTAKPGTESPTFRNLDPFAQPGIVYGHSPVHSPSRASPSHTPLVSALLRGATAQHPPRQDLYDLV